MLPVQNALPIPNAVLRGPFGSLVIVPSSLDTGKLSRFQVFSPYGGARLSQIAALQILQDAARSGTSMQAISGLYVNRQGGLAGFTPAMMLARLRRDLNDGIMFAAFYIPSEQFTAFVVTNPIDISALLTDPPGTPLNWTRAQRIAAMLRRIPGCVPLAMRGEVAALFTPKAIALLAALLVLLGAS